MHSFHESIVFNSRTLRAPCSGVQRYAQELARRWGADLSRLEPTHNAQGIRGHLWEQGILPWQLSGRLLFSPGNTGPLACRHQVVTIHDAATFDWPDAFTDAFGRWYRWLLPRLARRVERIVTVSSYSRDRLIHHLRVPAERISVVPNGVTLPGRIPSTEELESVRWRLRLPEKFFLFVGSNDPRKDLRRLLRAFDQARPPGWSLVVAGGANPRLFSDGSVGEALPADVHTLGRVEEADLDALYHLAGAFVFPSLYEGFGLPPLEAMARGCPVICSDSSCLPEVCGPDRKKGGAAWYFPAGNTAALAAAMVGFAESPLSLRHEMIAAGRRRVVLYSWDRCASETGALLEEVAGHSVSKPERWALPAVEPINPKETCS